MSRSNQIKGVTLKIKTIGQNETTFEPFANLTISCDPTPAQARMLASPDVQLHIYIMPGKSESKKPGPKVGSHRKGRDGVILSRARELNAISGQESTEKPPLPPEVPDTKGEARTGTNKGRIVAHEPPTGKDTDWGDHYLDSTPMTDAEKEAARKGA